VLRGRGPALAEWRARCIRPYAPRRLTLAIPSDATLPPGLLAERRAGDAPVTAYRLWQNGVPDPYHDIDELVEQLVTDS
jgi:hypothetical protein